MKIVYCYFTADTEGSKIHIDSFMHAFRALGEEIVEAGTVSRPFEGNKSEWSTARRIRAKMLWVQGNFSLLWRLLRLAVRHRPDLLLFRFMQNHQMFLPIFVLSRFYPVVLEINAVRSIENPSGMPPFFSMLDRITLSRSLGAFVVSETVRTHLSSVVDLSKRRIEVIENGVDVEAFTDAIPSESVRRAHGLEGGFVVGFVGSFKPWHGIGNLIALADAMKSEGLPVRYLVVGDGGERRKFEETVRAKGLADNFVFAGYVPHEKVREYISAMDVAMAPHNSDSFRESGGFHGSPLKIFEYMAMSKAIIAAPIGQIRDIIVDGESGRLIPSEDAEALKREILHLYYDRSYREMLGRNARQRVERYYTWKVNAEKVRALCRAAIGCHE
jgi:glycosyltransferase involved in cell wall biosynthesis